MNADDLIGMGSGITLRMYLIAHAPEDVPGWFQPVGVSDPEWDAKQRKRHTEWPGAWADRQIELENARNKT